MILSDPQIGLFGLWLNTQLQASLHTFSPKKGLVFELTTTTEKHFVGLALACALEHVPLQKYFVKNFS